MAQPIQVDPIHWATEITRKIRDEIGAVKTFDTGEVISFSKKPGRTGFVASVLLPGATTPTPQYNCISTYRPKVGDQAMLIYPKGSAPLLIGANPVEGTSPDNVEKMSGDLNLDDYILAFDYFDDTNIDHIWHDDQNSRFHFVSDGPRKSPGNAQLYAGSILTSGNAYIGGFDFVLGTTDQTTRGDTGTSRALVKNTGEVLHVNYNGDFSGGTVVWQTPWITPGLLNLWTVHSTGYNTPKYRKTSHGTVRIKGLVKGGSATTTTTIFTLPVGYRPVKSHIFSMKTNGVAGEATSARINVTSTGNVEFAGASESTQKTGWVSLDGIEFDLVE